MRISDVLYDISFIFNERHYKGQHARNRCNPVGQTPVSVSGTSLWTF